MSSVTPAEVEQVAAALRADEVYMTAVLAGTPAALRARQLDQVGELVQAVRRHGVDARVRRLSGVDLVRHKVPGARGFEALFVVYAGDLSLPWEATS